MIKLTRKRCETCRRLQDITCFAIKRSNLDGFQNHCRHCLNSKTRRRYRSNLRQERLRGREKYRAVKLEVFSHYGNECVCCKERALDFLAIDHIDNRGATHRRRLSMNSGVATYYWLKRNQYPSGFQVLCHNCNWSKHANDGLCVHELKS